MNRPARTIQLDNRSPFTLAPLKGGDWVHGKRERYMQQPSPLPPARAGAAGCFEHRRHAMKYRAKYSYFREFDIPRHVWSVLGAQGGLHLHINDYGTEHLEKYGYQFQGGIEVHYRHPPEYMRDNPPSSDECWLLKAPCWHDGSSLHAEERWIPLWRQMPHDHEGMFAALAQAADEMFGRKDE